MELANESSYSSNLQQSKNFCILILVLLQKQSVTEQGIPIQIHHEEATADDDLIPNKKINKNDLANAPRNTEKLEPMITDFETQALENERENSEGVVSSRDEENHVNVKQNDPEKKNSDEQPMTQKKESGSEATDDSEDEDRSKWDESPTLDYILIEAEKQFTNVLGNLEELVSEIKSFSGSRKEKTFLRLEHELTNKLLRLDGITAAGSPSENEIRAKRKEAVTRVQEALDILEDRVTS